jgi:site-specific recombinase
MRFRTIDFWAVTTLLTAAIVLSMKCSRVEAAQPDILTPYDALAKQMWAKGCRQTEPELAEPIEIKTYVSATGAISGIANVKIRAKCIFYPIAAPIIKPPVIEPGRIKLEWDAPTTRIDGTALLPTQIAGYQIYMDGVMAGYTSALLFELQAAPGKHKFELRTIDTQGLPSPFSPALEIVAR